MKHLLLLLALLGWLAPHAAWAEDENAPPEKPADEAGEEASDAEEVAIAWADSYEDAKTQADAEHKGVFVYLTPTWFT